MELILAAPVKDGKRKEAIEQIQGFITPNYDALEVNFESAPTVKDFKGRKYLTYGPLVYAKDIPAQRENIKSYALEGFHDYYCTPLTQYKERELLAASAVQQVEGENYPLLLVKTVKEGAVETDTLIPFGQTTLRQTTFTQRQ